MEKSSQIAWKLVPLIEHFFPLIEFLLYRLVVLNQADMQDDFVSLILVRYPSLQIQVQDFLKTF
jgi:hypothetical protein